MKLGWMNKDQEKALKSVQRRLSPKALCDAAIRSPHESVKLTVIDRLTDDRWLMKIAVSPSSGTSMHNVQKAALAKLTDKGLYEVVMTPVSENWIREEAVRMIRDQNLLADILQTSECGRAVEVACECLYGHDWVTVDMCHQRCSRCGKEQEFLDETILNRIKTFLGSYPGPQYDWREDRSGYIKHATDIEHMACPICGCITPYMKHTQRFFRTPTTTAEPEFREMWQEISLECPFCHRKEKYHRVY